MSKLDRSECGKLGGLKTKQLWRDRYASNPKKCAQCDKELSYEQRKNKFCGHSCSASFNNIGVCRNGVGSSLTCSGRTVRTVRTRKAPSSQFCLKCFSSISDKRRTRKFCSNLCQSDYRWELRKNNINETGIENECRVAKRYLKEIRGHACEICHITEWCGQPTPLVLDHIDGNSDNNLIINLRLVCGNCDMQLPTYKNKNKGKGRHNRRKRYAEGKSY